MGGYPIGETGQVCQSGLLCLPKLLDFNPSFGSTDGSTNGQDDDILQAVAFRSLHPGVFYFCKERLEISQLVFFQLISSAFWDLFYHFSELRCDCPGVLFLEWFFDEPKAPKEKLKSSQRASGAVRGSQLKPTRHRDPRKTYNPALP